MAITHGTPVTGTEIAKSLVLTKGNATVKLAMPFNIATAAPVLSKYATIYESYRIKSVSYRFKTFTTTFKSGSFNMGIDYGRQNKDLTLEQIGKLTPHYNGSVYQTSPWITISPIFVDTNLVRYTDDNTTLSTPFTLNVYAEAEADPNADRTIGIIEIRYKLQFLGILP